MGYVGLYSLSSIPMNSNSSDAGLIKQKLGNVARYQNTRIESLSPEA